MDFNTYMKQRQQKTQDLIKQADKSTAPYEDSRFWKPTIDKEKGVGGAVIRFLPVVDDSTLDYVEYRHYAFKFPATDRWYIENSLYTFQEADPIYELRQRLYKTKQETDKSLAQLMRLNTAYVANILVVNDPAHPENNGKQFLYRYNKTIQGFIDTALKPEADPLTGKVEESMNAFDLVNGSNLEIRISQTKQGWDYEKTKWATPSAIVNSQQDFEKITSGLYNLSEFTDRSKFKSYAELSKRLAYVIDADYIGSGVKVLTNGTVAELTATSKSQSTTQEPPADSFVNSLQPKSSAFEEYTPPYEESPFVETPSTNFGGASAQEDWEKEFDFS